MLTCSKTIKYLFFKFLVFIIILGISIEIDIFIEIFIKLRLRYFHRHEKNLNLGGTRLLFYLFINTKINYKLQIIFYQRNIVLV